MFFLISSTGSPNFIPFVNSSKTVIFLSFLPVARGLFLPSLAIISTGRLSPVDARVGVLAIRTEA